MIADRVTSMRVLRREKREKGSGSESPINLKTAKALYSTIPQSVLLRADEVIQ